MAREKLIDEITGFDSGFFATGDNRIYLRQMPEYALAELGIILKAAAEGKGAAIINDLSATAAIVRIDPQGKMIQDQLGLPEFSGVAYKAGGKTDGKEIALGHIEFPPSCQQSELLLKNGGPLKIRSEALVHGYNTGAEYIRWDSGQLRLTAATINFGKFHGGTVNQALLNDELRILPDGPAIYRFYDNWTPMTKVPVDGAEIAIPSSIPNHRLSVRKTVKEHQTRIDVSQAENDFVDEFAFSVLNSSFKPETPASGIITVDLQEIKEGEFYFLDQLALSLHALAPAEITNDHLFPLRTD